MQKAHSTMLLLCIVALLPTVIAADCACTTSGCASTSVSAGSTTVIESYPTGTQVTSVNVKVQSTDGSKFKVYLVNANNAAKINRQEGFQYFSMASKTSEVTCFNSGDVAISVTGPAIAVECENVLEVCPLMVDFSVIEGGGSVPLTPAPTPVPTPAPTPVPTPAPGASTCSCTDCSGPTSVSAGATTIVETTPISFDAASVNVKVQSTDGSLFKVFLVDANNAAIINQGSQGQVFSSKSTGSSWSPVRCFNSGDVNVDVTGPAVAIKCENLIEDCSINAYLTASQSPVTPSPPAWPDGTNSPGDSTVYTYTTSSWSFHSFFFDAPYLGFIAVGGAIVGIAVMACALVQQRKRSARRQMAASQQLAAAGQPMIAVEQQHYPPMQFTLTSSTDVE